MSSEIKGCLVGSVAVGVFGVLALVLCIVGWIAGWFTEAASVVKQEVGPKATLEKYEKFKDIAAILENKLATIEVYETQLRNYETDTKHRDEREALRQRQMEIAGMKASFNLLAARYNADMAKAHYAYANVGELPKGASQPLPREFKTYLVK